MLSPGEKRPRNSTDSSDLSLPQRVEVRGANDRVIVHSPYGSSRAIYGWGNLFQPPLFACVPGHPGIHIGISSLNAVPGKDRRMSTLLAQYRRKFHCLEHCYPYHKMADEAAWASWRDMCSTRTEDQQPFLYAIKANNYLTHVRLLDFDDSTEEHIVAFFAHRCSLLGRHMGPVLLQLPPQFHYSAEHMARLETIAAHIPKFIRIAVEFRHRSWNVNVVHELLRRVGWARVVAHHHDDDNKDKNSLSACAHIDTGVGFMYVRLHGSIGLHVGDYGPAAMGMWAERVAEYVRGASAGSPPREVFFFLNNSDSHVGGTTSSTVDATFLAQRLSELLKKGEIGHAYRGEEGNGQESSIPMNKYRLYRFM